jgi:ribosomal protein S18 acetylase RimI-like enzyme
MNFQIRNAQASDGDQMLALMPRLAAFAVPQSRDPEHLWRDDAKLLQSWLDGEAGDCLVQVAVDGTEILGLTLVRLRPELLSHAPSSHLEAIAVSETAEGQGVGQALLDAAENNAGRHGAKSMSLHVFASNTRARQFYERNDYNGELLRYIKDITG